jgi:hypothetical protein
MNSFTTAEIHPHTLAALGLGNIAWLYTLFLAYMLQQV